MSSNHESVIGSCSSRSLARCRRRY